ncbi:MAG: hypothetical protein Q9160_003828 [Pyrenula sp. 1 TL-2023]
MPNAADARLRFQALQDDQQLSILKLSSQIFSSSASTQAAGGSFSAGPSKTPGARTSDASSTDGSDNPTPASLRAELAHYKDLFTKLHFSYLEQVTKEKYLRSIVGDPPLVVSHAENVELETHLVGVKDELKQKKAEVEALRAEMEEIGRGLAERWEWCVGEGEKLETLPREVGEAEERVEALRARVKELEGERGEGQDGWSGEGMDLSLEETLERTEAGEEELRGVEREIELSKRQMPGKTRECEAAERELEVLEREKNKVCRAAGEERRRKEEGGRDRVEEAGRWWRNVEGSMITMGLGT